MTEIAPETIGDWLSKFARCHGDPAVSLDGATAVLTAPDGVTARLVGAVSGTARRGEPDWLARWAMPPRATGIVLVRRGGYAVGLGQGPRLLTHKCGTRYVQARTAAGGWSQQRFARRRGNQAADLAGAVAQLVVDRVLPGMPRLLILGGDRGLVRDVVADRRLAALQPLARREFYDLPDPGLAVLRRALWRGRAVRISVTGPPEPGPGII
ncbi:MAG: acVLRF1 family peptidyl-tRNA hydrolase [Mycobacteriales bacterium]